MPSISSKTAVRERALEYWKQNSIWEDFRLTPRKIKLIKDFLSKEYEIIPEKERIGKGMVYITKTIAEGLCKKNNILKFNAGIKFKKGNLLDPKSAQIFYLFTKEMLDIAQEGKKIDMDLFNFGMYLFSELSRMYPPILEENLTTFEKWVNSDDWRSREVAAASFRYTLKQNPELTLRIYQKWMKSNNENLRRAVSESCRPFAEIKWLRNPSKNDPIIEILTYLRSDPSIYVRKSIGNNFKDLSKYMPEKVLALFEDWIIEYGIEVTSDLASKEKSELGDEKYYLIWTMKQAMRWIKQRNPEYHDRLEKILGKNYVLYFDEKQNRKAIPK